MASKRATPRSSAGPKLYAKRGKSGQFVDMQSYKRAHGSDGPERGASRTPPATRGERSDAR